MDWHNLLTVGLYGRARTCKDATRGVCLPLLSTVFGFCPYVLPQGWSPTRLGRGLERAGGVAFGALPGQPWPSSQPPTWCYTWALKCQSASCTYLGESAIANVDDTHGVAHSLVLRVASAVSIGLILLIGFVTPWTLRRRTRDGGYKHHCGSWIRCVPVWLLGRAASRCGCLHTTVATTNVLLQAVPGACPHCWSLSAHCRKEQAVDGGNGDLQECCLRLAIAH